MSMHDIEDSTRGFTSDALRQIVRRGDGQISKSLAATTLLGRNQRRPVEAARLILEDDANTDTKRAAIKALGRSQERGVQDLLMANLRDPNPHILRDTVWSLARVGDRNGLEKLKQVDPRRNESLRADLEGAQRLLAFRLGQKGFGFDKDKLPKTAEMPREGVKAMEVSQVKAELLETSQKIIELETAGLEMDARSATQLVCLKQALWLMPGKLAVENPEELMERPGVAMAIFSHNGCTGAPFLKSYVLSEPDGSGNGAQIYVTRLRGQPTHSGHIRVSRAGLSFQMAALRTRFDPAAKIAGHIRPGGTFDITEAEVATMVDAQAKLRRTPTEMKPAIRPIRREPTSVR